MDKGKVQVIYGSGKGKTGAALGRAIQMLNQGKTVIVIQFLKGSGFRDFKEAGAGAEDLPV